MEVMKQKKIWIIIGITLLLAGICVMQMLDPKEQYYYAGSQIFAEGTALQDKVIYEQISLKPGVYEIILTYETDTDLQNYCTVKDDTVFYGGLLTNGTNLYKGLSKTSFWVWLFEDTEALQVTVSYGGTGSLQTGNLLIKETNRLWTMLLTLILTVAAAVLGLIYVRIYDKTYGISVEKKAVAFGLVVIVLFASLPYLQGVAFYGGDLIYHLQRIEGLKDGWLSGQFPVRLEPNWIHGHGYASAIFYCDILLAFPALLRLLGFTITASYNLYCIALNIATAWIAYYCFAKIFKNRYIGLICSALYTLAVYRICQLVVTTATGEGSAFTFMPLILYGLYRTFTENPKDKAYRTAWIPLAFGYAGLIQTHVLSCEITAFLTLIICMVQVRKIFRKETFFVLAKGAASAILMSLWFLVPFLDFFLHEDVHIKHVSGRTIQERGLYVAQLAFNWWKRGSNALLGENGMQDSQPFGLGLVLVISFTVFLIFWFGGKWKQERHPVIMLGKTGTVLGGMLMLMSLESFPWDKIQKMHPLAASLVSSIQFPYRFLGWATCFLVAVSGCLLWYFFQQKERWGYYLGVVCTLLGIITSSLYLIDYVCCGQNTLKLYNEEGMGFGYISGAEYLIQGTDESTLLYKDPVADNGVEIDSYKKEYLHVQMTCRNLGGEEGYVELPILHYNGYQAIVTETGEKLAVNKGNNNVVRVRIPSGFEGTIEVKFVSPVYWRISEVISFLGWIVVVAVCIKYLRGKGRHKGEKEKCVL